MQPVSIIGNHFSVVVRQLKIHDIQSAQKTIPQIQQNGYNNYFDDQRFGSFDRDQGFLGDKLLKQQLNGALKIYVTGIHPENSKEEKERKRFFFSHWKDWQSCMQVAETQAERRTFDSLCRHPHDFLSCLRQIPHEAMSLYLSAYQSFLWNKVLTKITIKVSIPPLQIYPGTAGEYQFYDQLLHGQRDFLENLQIPTYGQGLNYPDPFIRKTYQEVLSEEGLKPGSYNQLRIRQSFMKSFNRPAIIRPESIQCQFQNDEIYPSNLKLHLDFSLPRGAYATMLLKRIFSQSSLHPSMPETVTN